MTAATMTTREAFLADVLAHPEDDYYRMVYADWLQEQGDPYGEFIAVQLETARLEKGHTGFHKDDGSQYSCRVCTLRKRERELRDALIPGDLCRYETLWAGAAASLLPKGSYTFRRGFVHAVTLSAQDWLAHADVLLAAQPVREVTLSTWPDASWDSAPLSVQSNCFLVGRSFSKVRFSKCHDIMRHNAIPERLPTRTEMAKALLELEWPGLTFHLPGTA